MPRMPSNLAAMKTTPGCLMASPKVCLCTVTLPGLDEDGLQGTCGPRGGGSRGQWVVWTPSLTLGPWQPLTPVPAGSHGHESQLGHCLSSGARDSAQGKGLLTLQQTWVGTAGVRGPCSARPVSRTGAEPGSRRRRAPPELRSSHPPTPPSGTPDLTLDSRPRHPLPQAGAEAADTHGQDVGRRAVWG